MQARSQAVRQGCTAASPTNSDKHSRPDSSEPLRSANGPPVSPPAFLRGLYDCTIAAGCDIRLRVVVSGVPRPELRWFQDGVQLERGTEVYGALWLEDCLPKDVGVYTCVAVNGTGVACSSAHLTVVLPEGTLRP